MAPYQCEFRHVATTLRRPGAQALHVLVVKAQFDTTVDITIHNFAEALAEDFVFTFLPAAEADGATIRRADLLVLYRTIDEHSEELARMARREDVPVVFLMDDDLLWFHELATNSHTSRRARRAADFWNR